MVGEPQVVRELLMRSLPKNMASEASASCTKAAGEPKAPRAPPPLCWLERLLGGLALRELEQRCAVGAASAQARRMGVVDGQLRARARAPVRVQAFRSRERQLQHLGVVAPVAERHTAIAKPSVRSAAEARRRSWTASRASPPRRALPPRQVLRQEGALRRQHARRLVSRGRHDSSKEKGPEREIDRPHLDVAGPQAERDVRVRRDAVEEQAHFPRHQPTARRTTPPTEPITASAALWLRTWVPGSPPGGGLL